MIKMTKKNQISFFQQAKSTVVKEKIKMTSWGDRQYVIDLLRLEKYVLEEEKPYEPWVLQILQTLMLRYEKEYLEILKELKTHQYEWYMEYSKEQKKLNDDKEFRDSWVAMGGK